MIQPNELRIGNLLLTGIRETIEGETKSIPTGYPVKVNEVRTGGAFCYLTKTPSYYYFESQDLHGIPLEDQLFEKMGYRHTCLTNTVVEFKIQLPKLRGWDVVRSISAERGEWSGWTINLITDFFSTRSERTRLTYHIEYLHQLQNIFFLIAGEELDVSKLLE